MDRRFPVFVNNSSDFYNVGDDSSSDGEADSSGDEIDRDFNGANEESDSDSFEKEMERELNEQFSQYSQHLFDGNSQNTEMLSIEATKEEQDVPKQDESLETQNVKQDEKVYDEMYFSSGSEDDEDNVGGVSSKSKERRQMKTDDELLYDPNMDDEDEKWVNKQREGHRQNIAGTEARCEDETTHKANNNATSSQKMKTKKNTSSTKNFSSDAILSCPACLTTLCIDCQRHDTYKQQFRAMFVMNCQVISDETLRYEAKKQKKKLSKKKKDLSLAEESELYNPVQCTSCNTEVAVFDKDEIYHFFNIVESLP